MLNILKIIFYIPLYNAFIALFMIPGIDAGLAVIIFTLIVRFALYPLSKKGLLAQVKMKEIEPQLKEIKKKFTDPKEQGAATMKLYKENGINPLAGFFVLLIQLPIIISLYRIFTSGAISHIDPSLLYFFVHPIYPVSTTLIGLFDVTQISTWAALLAAGTQFIQAQFQPLPSIPTNTDAKGPSFQNELARSMGIQMRYVLPVMIFFITFRLPAVIALYFITSNIFMIIQELMLRPHRKKLTKVTE